MRIGDCIDGATTTPAPAAAICTTMIALFLLAIPTSSQPLPSSTAKPTTPYTVWMTHLCGYPDDCPPAKIREPLARAHQMLAQYAPEYRINFHNDTAAYHYLTSTWGPAVAEKWVRIGNRAHKADLWRYCVLYKEGGVYMDMDTTLVRPLTEIFPDRTRCTRGKPLKC